MMKIDYHNAVLLHESVDGLDIKPNGIYVDVTFGGGGHSKEILKRLGSEGKLFAFDQDKDAIKNSLNDERFVLIHENFKFTKQFLRLNGVRKVDGILADLGVSSHQFDVPDRGFSTRFDANLDMRMNQEDSKTAFDIINYYDKDTLANVLFQYGELRNSRAIAAKIITEREVEKIKTSFQLKKVLQQFLPKAKEHKILAQIFQALRIEVNEEIEVLKAFLLQTVDLLNKGGKLSVISYHSLEDRLVKRLIQKGKFEGELEKDFYGNFTVPFKKDGKMIVPSKEQIKQNNRARSAKLRVAFKM